MGRDLLAPLRPVLWVVHEHADEVEVCREIVAGVAVVGLNNYGEAPLADSVARRWICGNIAGFRRSRILVEKYNVLQGGGGGGGEYALQVGFGWTNGVLRALALLYPQLSSLSPQRCKALHQARERI